MEDGFMLTKREQRQALPARVLELGLEWKVLVEKLSIWNMSIKTANLEESFFFLEESLFMPFIKFKCYQLHLLRLVCNIWKYQVIMLCTWNWYKLYLNLKIMKTALEKYCFVFPPKARYFGPNQECYERLHYVKISTCIGLAPLDSIALPSILCYYFLNLLALLLSFFWNVPLCCC